MPMVQEAAAILILIGGIWPKYAEIRKLDTVYRESAADEPINSCAFCTPTLHATEIWIFRRSLNIGGCRIVPILSSRLCKFATV